MYITMACVAPETRLQDIPSSPLYKPVCPCMPTRWPFIICCRTAQILIPNSPKCFLMDNANASVTQIWLFFDTTSTFYYRNLANNQVTCHLRKHFKGSLC